MIFQNITTAVAAFANSFFAAIIIATPLFMVANIVGGVILSDFKGTWDKNVFKASIVKYIAILFMSLLLYFGGVLSEVAINELLMIDLPIIFVVQIGLATLCANYAKDAVLKYKDVVGMKITPEGDEDNEIRN